MPKERRRPSHIGSLQSLNTGCSDSPNPDTAGISQCQLRYFLTQILGDRCGEVTADISLRHNPWALKNGRIRLLARSELPFRKENADYRKKVRGDLTCTRRRTMPRFARQGHPSSRQLKHRTTPRALQIPRPAAIPSRMPLLGSYQKVDTVALKYHLHGIRVHTLHRNLRTPN